MERVEFPGHTDVVAAMAYALDGTRLFTAGADGAVRAWPLGGGAPRLLGGARGTPQALSVDARGERIVVQTREGEALLWHVGDLAAPKVISVFHEDPDAAILAVDLSADGRTLAALASNGGIYLFATDAPDDYRIVWAFGQDPERILFGREGAGALRVLAAFGRGGATLVDLANLPAKDHAGDDPDIGRDHDIARVEIGVGTRYEPPFYRDAAMSPDGSRVALVSGDWVEIYATEACARAAPGTRAPPEQQLFGGASLRCVRFFDDGRRVLTAAGDGSARVMRVDGLTWAPLVLAHPHPLFDAAVGPGGAVVATQDDRSSITLWRVDGTQPPLEVSHPKRCASAFALDPTGRSVAIGYDRGLVEVVRFDAGWRARFRLTGEPLGPEPVDTRAAPGTIARALVARTIQWLRTGDPDLPYLALVDGQTYVLLQRKPGRFTLATAEQKPLVELDAWPEDWQRPGE